MALFGMRRHAPLGLIVCGISLIAIGLWGMTTALLANLRCDEATGIPSCVPFPPLLWTLVLGSGIPLLIGGVVLRSKGK